MPIVALSELQPNQEADFFALLTAKEELSTREGQPYFKVTFRDGGRQVSFPIWNNAPHASACRDQWTAGTFYKLRAVYRETNYGPQLEIHRIREVVDADRADGFDANMCLPRSRFDPLAMLDQLLAIVAREIENAELRSLVEKILQENRETILVHPAASRMHHAYRGGWLEHTLSVTRNCAFFATKYAELYPEMRPPLDRGLVVAGGVLHDIGKLRELQSNLDAVDYTPAGHLLGHAIQGRDMLREAALGAAIQAETLLRLEHIIVAHQRLPEWGAPKPPMTPEALLVHYADDVDAKFEIAYTILRDDSKPGPMTGRKNQLGHAIFRGEPRENE